jgi:competence protein ComEA
VTRPLSRPATPLQGALLGLACAALLLLPHAAGAVELNSASQAQLETVRGLGPALSQQLLEERRKAPFADWADVVRRVPGIGRASAAKLSAAGLTVQGRAYAPPPHAASAPVSAN